MNSPTPKKYSQRDAKAMHVANARLDVENMKLKLKLESLAVGNLNVIENFFAVVDSFFTEDDVKTLGEAKAKWYKFKATLEDTDDMDKALAAIDRVSSAHPERNACIINEWWS